MITAVAAALITSAQRAKSVIRHPFVAVHAVPRMEGSPDRLGLAALGLPRRRGGGCCRLRFSAILYKSMHSALSVVSRGCSASMTFDR